MPVIGIFPTQGLYLGLLHFRQILYRLSHLESPNNILSNCFLRIPSLTMWKNLVNYLIYV